MRSRRGDPMYGSQRSVVLGTQGMACTSQPLASFVAAHVLRDGGNAVDAAVAAAAMLGVVEPFMTGIGGDCFALVWSATEGRLYGLNGSGRAPVRASAEALRAQGASSMPLHGIHSVTVPGAVDAWAKLLERFGSRSLKQCLDPAIEYARNGFPVSEIISVQWTFTLGLLRDAEARAAFSVEGAPPGIGSLVRLPALAESLQTIAREGREGLYRGSLAERIGAFVEAEGGALRADDLAAHESTWVEPLSTRYRGWDLFEIPPNSQGITALMALDILECFDIAGHEPDDPERLHLLIEATKQAFVDRNRFIADPEHVDVPIEDLLSKERTRRRAEQISPKEARVAEASPLPVGSDTVSLTTADRHGNVVSLINSLFGPFGSGLVVPGTGIVLQNRGAGFSLAPEHPNVLAPRKRPFHTLIPAMLFRDGAPRVSFGVMGGDMQPQGHVQVVSNLVDHGAHIQEAIDWPRFRFLDGNRTALERRLDERAGRRLRELGHVIENETAVLASGGFGGGQGIAIDAVDGVYAGGSDARKDGCAVGF